MQLSQRSLYPDSLYDDLYQAGLIGEGKIVVYAKQETATVERRKSGSNTWEKVKSMTFDQSLATQTFVPCVDGQTGQLYGDWRKGLTSEQIKKINEEAAVPIFDDNTPIVIAHEMEFDLANPIHKAKFDILKFNDGIALSQDSVTEDQDFYFFAPKEEKKKRQKELDIKQLAVELISKLSQAGKEQILALMKYEKGLYIEASATPEDRLMLFKEMCWDRPKEIVEISDIQKKDTRIMMHVLIEYNLLVNPQMFGPVYRPSTREGQQFGEMLGENFNEAIKAFGRAENADLIRAYESIKNGNYEQDNILDKIVQKSAVGYDNLLSNVSERAKYELPAKINKNWLNNVSKAGLLAYLESKGIEESEETTNKILRTKALELFDKDSKNA